MKRILGLCAFLLWSASAFAQPSPVTERGFLRSASSTCSDTSNSACVILGINASSGTVAIQITGTFSATTIFEATVDGSNWATLNCISIVDGTAATGATAAGAWACPTAGLSSVRVRASVYASGVASVVMVSSAANSGGNVNVTSSGSALATEATQLLVLAAVSDTTPVAVNVAAAATGGATTYTRALSLTTTCLNIKATPGVMTYAFAEDLVATSRYVRWYDTAGTPDGTSATGIVWRAVIPPPTSTPQVGGFSLSPPQGLQFSSGIGYCVTVTTSDTANDPITAGDVTFNVGYK